MDTPLQTEPQTESPAAPHAETPAKAGRGKKKPRGRPFTGRDDPRARTNVGPKEPLDTETQDTLAAMRHVVSGQPIRTHQQDELRKWLNKSRDKFMSQMMALEKSAMEAAQGQKSLTLPGGGKVESDEGSDRAEVLIERLLHEAGEGITHGTCAACGAAWGR